MTDEPPAAEGQGHEFFGRGNGRQLTSTSVPYEDHLFEGNDVDDQHLPPAGRLADTLDIELPDDAKALEHQQHAAIDATYDHVEGILDGIIEQANSTKSSLNISRESAKRSVSGFFRTAHSAAAVARPTEVLINQLGAPAPTPPGKQLEA